MPRLPVVAGIDVVKALTRAGFTHIRTAGSHAILRKESTDGKLVIPVPLHKELAKGTLLSIIRQCGLSKEELVRLLS